MCIADTTDADPFMQPHPFWLPTPEEQLDDDLDAIQFYRLRDRFGLLRQTSYLEGDHVKTDIAVH